MTRAKLGNWIVHNQHIMTLLLFQVNSVNYSFSGQDFSLTSDLNLSNAIQQWNSGQNGHNANNNGNLGGGGGGGSQGGINLGNNGINNQGLAANM